MSIAEDIQKLAPGALVELFVLDATSLPGGGINYFHAGTNGLGGPVVWQGAEYQPWPVEARGFEKSGTGRLPRPTLTMANVAGTIGALARDFNDLLGARVLRKRTFVRYLDAVNFPGGVNPTASPVDAFPDDEFVVDQKTSESKHFIEFALAARCGATWTASASRCASSRRCAGGSTGRRAAATWARPSRRWTTVRRRHRRRTGAGSGWEAASCATGKPPCCLLGASP